MKHKFDCGCEFEIHEEDIKECDGLPSISIDYYNIPEDCPATWALIQTGRTKGIFQLESNLGRKWAKQVAPSNLEEMSALISLMRPGCLKAIVDGKNMPEHYCERKNMGVEVKYFHDALAPILKETYGVLTYQEQSMRIAQDIAGFNLQDADVLRKAIGKKKADIMAKVKGWFKTGCEKVGILDTEETDEIFGWIQESQRYSFNKSHGISYGDVGYWTAYAKAHFPIHFYTAWLYYSHEKQKPQKEMQQLISDAKYFDINVCPPTLTRLFKGDLGHFSMENDSIYFGIGDIKGIGESHVSKILKNVEEIEKLLGRKINDWTWYEFLILFSNTVSQTVITNIIAAGATDYMGNSRNNKTHEYNEWRNLTAGEQKWIKENCRQHTKLIDAITTMLAQKSRITASRRIKIEDVVKNLKVPPYPTTDDASYIAGWEHELLGVPVTCSKLDTCNTNLEPDTTCKEFLQGKSGNMLLCVEILTARESIIKRGKTKGQAMMYLSVEDDTGSIDSVVVFPNVLQGNEPVLIEGGTVMLSRQRDKKFTESFVVNKVTQI